MKKSKIDAAETLPSNPADQIETLQLEDNNILGYLSIPQYHGKITITYAPSPTGRVAGTVRGLSADIQQAFADLSANKPVPARDLIDAIKRARTAIFTMKAQGLR